MITCLIISLSILFHNFEINRYFDKVIANNINIILMVLVGVLLGFFLKMALDIVLEL